MQCTGTELNSPRKRIASRMSSGPVEQLRPMTSTFSASSVASTALMSVPRSILPPLGRSETLHWIGTARPSSLAAWRTPNTAALSSRMSWVVSMMTRSTPPSMRPVACSAKTVCELREGDLSQRRVVGRGQEAGGADGAGHEAILAGRLAGDLRRLEVDLVRVSLQAPLAELQPAGLERVGLEHLGARVEHRGMDALDHVGAVEHQRLVAAAGEAVVLLQAQVELLERRAHAPVKDDDALADRG